MHKRFSAALAGAALAATLAFGAQPALAAPAPGPTTPAPASTSSPRPPAAGPTRGPASGRDQAKALSRMAAANADGYLYAFDNAWFDYDGKYCKWSGDSSDWYYAGWSVPTPGVCYNYFIEPHMQDQASSLWNNGYPGLWPDVLLFRDTNYDAKGGSICLKAGDYWADLSLGIERYNTGEMVQDSISSHYWTSC